MTHNVEIRTATPADRAQMATLTGDLQRFEAQFEPNRCPPEEMQERHLHRIQSWAEKTGGASFVAAQGDRVVGFAVCGIDDYEPYVLEAYRRIGRISDLVVAEGLRGLGVGRALIGACEAHLVAAGMMRIEIGVLYANAAARAAYAACGYRPADLTVERYFGGPLAEER